MSALPPKADIGTQSRNVRFGSKADIAADQLNVRFTPKSGPRRNQPARRRWHLRQITRTRSSRASEGGTCSERGEKAKERREKTALRKAQRAEAGAPTDEINPPLEEKQS